jgi:hypothetical protein
VSESNLQGIARRSETDKEGNEDRKITTVNKISVLMTNTDFGYVYKI